ncbi:MAG: HlyD family type I secretion periplasmic adaptor subunit [Pseudomonadota bacterium]
MRVLIGGEALRARLGDWLRQWVPLAPDPNAGWGADADWARLQQEPIRARALLRWATLVVAVLMIWAGFAKVEEVTKGEGKVIPSSQLQIVQSVDGGVVEQIVVRQGQQVEQGALLLQIDPTRFVSNLRDNRSQYLALKVRAARLIALTEGGAFEPPAAESAEAPDIVERERALFESSRAERDASVHIARDQVAQREREIQVARARYRQADEGLRLTTQELNVTRPLIRSGAVSEVEVLRLERQVSALSGERRQASAQIQQTQAALDEAQRKVDEVALTFDNRWRNELAETMARLNSLSESGTALADRVSKAEVRSPVRGTVKRLLVNTVGGVVQPGDELLEIVPLDDALLLETKIRPRDIAFLRPQQPAMVKFTAYDFAIYGGLEAEVEQIGADTVTDENGNAFYIVRVRTHKTSLGDDLPIIPGMVAEVDIVTGEKTVLSYLLKPVLRAQSNALRER